MSSRLAAASAAPLVGDLGGDAPIEGADTLRVGVVQFPGSLDERDAQRAMALAGTRTVLLWHGDDSLQDVDAVILPGGFSYGDYLRCGAIARFAPVLEKVVDAAKGGMPVLGICNGFQILCESHLLPGALIRNDHQQFICRDQGLVVENADTAWTRSYSAGEEIVIPLKNGEGGYVASDSVLDELEGTGRVVARYSGGNPNGSMRGIAGIANERGNVVGLMPHPEHAVEAGFGPDSADGMRTGVDGQGFFTSVVRTLLA